MSRFTKFNKANNVYIKLKIKLKTSKGQLTTTDFILAIIILTLIIQTSMTAWNRNLENIRRREIRTQIENLALSVSDMLIKGPGVPDDWSDQEVKTLGLADELNVLDPAKVTAFTNLDKDSTKNLAGLEGYNFSFILRDTDDAVLVEYGEQWAAAEEIVIVRRLVLYNDEPALMEFRLW